MTQTTRKKKADANGHVSPAVLRNKGVPITLNKIDTGTGEIITDDRGNAITEEVTIRFTNANLMALEEQFEGIDNFAEWLFRRPVTATCRSLSILLACPLAHAANRIVTGRPLHYVKPILAAWELANGSDPQKVAEFINVGPVDLVTLISTLQGGTPMTAESAGTSGSAPGSPPAEPSPSSGS